MLQKAQLSLAANGTELMHGGKNLFSQPWIGFEKSYKYRELV